MTNKTLPEVGCYKAKSLRQGDGRGGEGNISLVFFHGGWQKLPPGGGAGAGGGRWLPDVGHGSAEGAEGAAAGTGAAHLFSVTEHSVRTLNWTLTHVSVVLGNHLIMSI